MAKEPVKMNHLDLSQKKKKNSSSTVVACRFHCSTVLKKALKLHPGHLGATHQQLRD